MDTVSVTSDSTDQTAPDILANATQSAAPAMDLSAATVTCAFLTPNLPSTTHVPVKLTTQEMIVASIMALASTPVRLATAQMPVTVMFAYQTQKRVMTIFVNANSTTMELDA